MTASIEIHGNRVDTINIHQVETVTITKRSAEGVGYIELEIKSLDQTIDLVLFTADLINPIKLNIVDATLQPEDEYGGSMDAVLDPDQNPGYTDDDIPI